MLKPKPKGGGTTAGLQAAQAAQPRTKDDDSLVQQGLGNPRQPETRSTPHRTRPPSSRTRCAPLRSTYSRFKGATCTGVAKHLASYFSLTLITPEPQTVSDGRGSDPLHSAKARGMTRPGRPTTPQPGYAAYKAATWLKGGARLAIRPSCTVHETVTQLRQWRSKPPPPSRRVGVCERQQLLPLHAGICVVHCFKHKLLGNNNAHGGTERQPY